MFCSNCGKSIRPEDASCPHCGAVLGEDRFLGNMYTSSQVRLPVDAAEHAPGGSLSGYTRTDYMSYDNQPEDDVYSNTTYRPLLNDEEDLGRREQEAEEEPAEDTPAQPGDSFRDDEPADDAYEPEEASEAPAGEYEDDGAEDVPGYDAGPADDGETSVSPLPEIKPRGISPAVQRYMREAEERHQNQAQRGGRKLHLPFWKKPKPEAEYDEEEPAEDIPGAAAEPEAAEEEGYEPETAEAEDGYEPETAEAEDGYEPEAAEAEDAYEPEAADEEGYEEDDGDDESYEEDDGEGGRPKFKFDLSALKKNRTLQIAIAAALVLAVLIGGIRWVLYVTSSLGTKIAGVTHGTYSEGIKLINEFSADEYRDNLVNTGSVNMTYAQQQMSEDMNKLSALMPAEPQENDQLFVTALTIVHEGIQNVIKADAQAVYSGTQSEREAASQQEWAAVKDAVKRLNEATTASELSALASDVQAAVVPTPTPAPTPEPAPTATPEPVPTTLTEGMKNSAEVKRMQRRLIELGYLDKGADGDFGPKTGKALKAFQEAAGLTVDGIATQEVLDALYAEDAPKAKDGTETTEADKTSLVEV